MCGDAQMVSISRNAVFLFALFCVVIGVSTSAREFVLAHPIITAAVAVIVIGSLQYNEWRGGVTSIYNHDAYVPVSCSSAALLTTH